MSSVNIISIVEEYADKCSQKNSPKSQESNASVQSSIIITYSIVRGGGGYAFDFGIFVHVRVFNVCMTSYECHCLIIAGR